MIFPASFRCLFVPLLATVLAAGCSDAPDLHPRAVQSLVFSADHPAVAVDLGLGCELRVTLPDPGRPGFEWEMVSNNVKVLEQRNALHSTSGPGAFGAAAIAFYSLKPGRSVLRFVLVRPGDNEAVPAARYEATVTVAE